MSKVLNYLSILAIILIGAHLLGLITNTGSSTLLSWLANPELLFTTTVFSSLTNILTLTGVATSTVAIGLALSRRGDLAIMVGFSSLMFLVGWDILAIYNEIRVINGDFALLLISPILLIYMLSVIEFFRGTG